MFHSIQCLVQCLRGGTDIHWAFLDGFLLHTNAYIPGEVAAAAKGVAAVGSTCARSGGRGRTGILLMSVTL